MRGAVGCKGDGVASGAATATALAAMWGSPTAGDGDGTAEMLSLLEIGRRAAMKAEREAIERVLTQTRWNRREAAF